jgi:hypothetical protein
MTINWGSFLTKLGCDPTSDAELDTCLHDNLLHESHNGLTMSTGIIELSIKTSKIEI